MHGSQNMTELAEWEKDEMKLHKDEKVRRHLDTMMYSKLAQWNGDRARAGGYRGRPGPGDLHWHSAQLVESRRETAGGKPSTTTGKSAHPETGSGDPYMAQAAVWERESHRYRKNVSRHPVETIEEHCRAKMPHWHGTTVDQVCRGLEAIMQRQLWLSVSLMSSAIKRRNESRQNCTPTKYFFPGWDSLSSICTNRNPAAFTSAYIIRCR